MMKLFLLLSIFYPAILLAQISIHGVVVDEDNMILPMSNIVFINKNMGTITDENGVFNLSIFSAIDSIKITNIAYVAKVISLFDLQKNDTVKLKKNIHQLKDLVIRDFSKYSNEINIGFNNYPNNGEFKFGPGQQIATYIANENSSEGWIKGVGFRVKDFGKCKNSLRIRLLQLDTINFKPSIDLLEETILIQSSDLKRTNYIDLSAYKIILPKEGIFIVLEWLYPDTVCDKNSYTTIAANLSLSKDIVSFNFWDREWRKGNRPRMDKGNFITPNVLLRVGELRGH